MGRRWRECLHHCVDEGLVTDVVDVTVGEIATSDLGDEDGPASTSPTGGTGRQQRLVQPVLPIEKQIHQRSGLARGSRERVSLGDARFQVLVHAAREVGVMERIVDAYTGEAARRICAPNSQRPGGALEEGALLASRSERRRRRRNRRRRSVAAACSAVKAADYDEIVLSTLPVGVSRWLGMDVPQAWKRSRSTCYPRSRTSCA